MLESFAAGVPCLLTPPVNDGLILPSTLASLIGRGPQDLADRVVALHGGGPLYDSIVAEIGVLMARSLNRAAVAGALEGAIKGNLPAWRTRSTVM